MMRHQISTRAALLPLLGVALFPAQAPAQTLLKPQSAQVALGNLPLRALWALESNDLPTLAKLAHSKGIQFSSDIFVDGDQTFTPAQIRRLKGSRKYLWGSYDGTGDPIRLSWAGYRKQFVWKRDFSKGKLAFNTFTSRGNTINNLRDAYKDAVFVESYLPGSAKYGGMNWDSLWTVWKREGGQWKLRGIANDYWTT